MQFKIDQYKQSQHDRWRALTVKQPYATDLVTVAFKEEDGTEIGVKSIEVRSKNCHYRGDVMICSSASPVLHGLESGVCVGLVELYDVKLCKDFTPEDWENTRIPEAEQRKYKTCFGWMMRNPRRVVEFPVTGQLGLFNLVYTKDTITEYPRVVVMDRTSYKLASKIERKPKNEK
jgi:hypothetical protein